MGLPSRLGVKISADGADLESIPGLYKNPLIREFAGRVSRACDDLDPAPAHHCLSSDGYIP
jgi:hypothetical protein